MERFIIFEPVFVAGSSQSCTVFIRYTILALYLMILVIFCYLNHFFINDCHVSGIQWESGKKCREFDGYDSIFLIGYSLGRFRVMAELLMGGFRIAGFERPL